MARFIVFSLTLMVSVTISIASSISSSLTSLAISSVASLIPIEVLIFFRVVVISYLPEVRLSMSIFTFANTLHTLTFFKCHAKPSFSEIRQAFEFLVSMRKSARASLLAFTLRLCMFYFIEERAKLGFKARLVSGKILLQTLEVVALISMIPSFKAPTVSIMLGVFIFIASALGLAIATSAPFLFLPITGRSLFPLFGFCL